MGPVPFSRLQELARRGSIRPEHRVWKRGERLHVRADQISGLFGRLDYSKITCDTEGIEDAPKKDITFTRLYFDENEEYIKPEGLIWRSRWYIYYTLVCISSIVWHYLFASSGYVYPISGSVFFGTLTWAAITVASGLPVTIATGVLSAFFSKDFEAIMPRIWAIWSTGVLCLLGWGQVSESLKTPYELQQICIEQSAYEVRSGARCSDGSSSSATGSGACSWHGGVDEWVNRIEHSKSSQECLEEAESRSFMTRRF